MYNFSTLLPGGNFPPGEREKEREKVRKREREIKKYTVLQLLLREFWH